MNSSKIKKNESPTSPDNKVPPYRGKDQSSPHKKSHHRESSSQNLKSK